MNKRNILITLGILIVVLFLVYALVPRNSANPASAHPKCPPSYGYQQPPGRSCDEHPRPRPPIFDWLHIGKEE